MALGKDVEQNAHEQSSRRHGWLRRRGVTVIPALVLVGLLAYGFLAPARDDEDPRGAPRFEEPLLTEEGTLSDDDLRGRPVVLNFWASWCGPCREEMPALQRMADRYAGEGVQVIGVLVQDSAEGGRAFLEEVEVDYPMIYDADNSLAKALDLYGLPQTFFIDADYRFTADSAEEAVSQTGDRVVLGAISEERLESNIRALLEED
jgi:cytochrome c biogenesis protein CcmG, thiol:disulfide interchange protein DsbE